MPRCFGGGLYAIEPAARGGSAARETRGGGGDDAAARTAIRRRRGGSRARRPVAGSSPRCSSTPRRRGPGRHGLVLGIHVFRFEIDKTIRWPEHGRSEVTPSFGHRVFGHDEGPQCPYWASIRNQLALLYREGACRSSACCAGEPDPIRLWSPLGWLATATLWCVYFFRDPERVTPLREGIVVAPADGLVSRITNAVPPADLYLGDRPLPRISIFMSVFDCWPQPQPGTRDRAASLTTRVRSSAPTRTRRARATSATASWIATTKGKVGVVIAGLIARRILCRARRRDRRRRRAHRHDPAGSGVDGSSARRRKGAGGRGPDRRRRRNHHRRPARGQSAAYLPGRLTGR